MEIGAGAGACGMVAALMGARATLTDRPRYMGLLWQARPPCGELRRIVAN